MNSTPQVQTQEIADAELDNVAGGLVHETLGTATGLVSGATGVDVNGTVGTATGLVEGTTGLNTAPVTGIVTSL
ncbi:type A2 lantipeptide [Streptomyces halobius]|uniref:Type A2 lantipeptide n=1 Tax=Streptomyces halobius TaxID=2879846 RepID=A0ABY4MGP5_9ACTN|nr:type A2 lantipeptide [Streptomyces halobius]UQA96984.1 type A2 lantipeptide [Streptomyces halobius]